jgi:hypothetical protein
MLRSFEYARPVTAGATMMIAIGAGLLMGAPLASAHDGYDSDKSPVYLDRTVHPTAEDACVPGRLWQGSGNPSTTFQRKRDEDAGIELAIKGIVRQGPDIRSTYVDDDGRVHIEVPAGAQPGNPARAAWNFTYSYNVALDPANPSLDKYEAELWIDLDPSRKTDYLKLKLAKLGPPPAAVPCNQEPDTNGYGWKAGSTVAIPDDDGTDRVTQNSQNLAFYAALIDTNRHMPGIQPYTFGPGQFDVVMKIKRKWRGRDEVKLHVVFDVVTAPTQTP